MDLKVNNVENIQRVLKGLDDKIRTKIIRKALRLISKPILKSAKEKVWLHQRKGRLYRSLGEKATKQNGDDVLIIGARKTGKYKGSHAHFLENGTKQRSYITKAGVKKNTGKVKGIKFWSTSIEKGSEKSESEYHNYIIQSIEKEVDSLYRKANK